VATLYTIVLISTLLAWVNARTGRVDRRGAIRLVIPFFLLALAAWLIGGHHVVAWEVLQQFRHAVSQAMVGAALAGIAYLAVEPHVRRRWPTVLVTWSRVLAGRWRDPLVGRDVLAGLAFGAARGLIIMVVLWWGSRTMDAGADIISQVLSGRTTLAVLTSIPLAAIAPALALTVLMLVLRTVVRGNLLAVALVTVLAMVSTVSVATGASGVGGMLAAGVFALLATTCLIRFGLVAVVACFLTERVFTVLRAALAWNTGMGMLILAAIVALTLAAAYIAMGSPKLPREVKASA
jgi:eukaryotic-like serine/threonine-protein kinase